MAKANKLRYADISTEDELVDLDNMHEQQARAVPRLANLRVLLLNADYLPMSYKPLSTIPWTQAFFWLSKGWSRMADGGDPIITVVEEYDQLVHSGHQTFRVPSVVALTKMAAMPDRAPFNRGNVYLRDDYTCQYSGIRYPVSELTLDHVHPQSRGGKTNWTNLVTCHKEVNFKKADRTPKEAGLRLLREPYVPNAWELREKGRAHPSPFGHESWADYVYWSIELEQS
jgi:5-methylcytosine-specific restriction endonuclease McrA